MAVTTICQLPDNLILWIDKVRKDKSRAAFIKHVLSEAERSTRLTTNRQRMDQEDDEYNQNICKNIS